MNTYTSATFKQMQDYFFSGATADYKFRKQQLLILKSAIQKYEEQIMEALFKDLHKSKEEAKRQ